MNFKSELEEKLDEMFPKHNCKERGAALVLFAYAQILFDKYKTMDKEDNLSPAEIMRKQQNEELCGYMILTPTPEHNGGMTCANLKSECKLHNIPPNATRHGEDGLYQKLKDNGENQRLSHEMIENAKSMNNGLIFNPLKIDKDEFKNLNFKVNVKENDGVKKYRNDEQPTFPMEDCGCEACIGSRKETNSPDAVEPSEWETGLTQLVSIAWKKGLWHSESKMVDNLRDFIRTTIQLESDKAYRRGQRYAKVGIYSRVNRFLGQVTEDIPRIHPFHEGIILDIIKRDGELNTASDNIPPKI